MMSEGLDDDRLLDLYRATVEAFVQRCPIKVADGVGFEPRIEPRIIVGGLDAMLEETRKAGEPLVFQSVWGSQQPVGTDDLVLGWLDQSALQAVSDKTLRAISDSMRDMPEVF